MYIDEGYDRALEEGMVFHNPAAARVGKFGVCFSETWAVAATGCEVLSNLKRELTVVPV